MGRGRRRTRGGLSLSLPAGGTLDDMLDTLLAHLADGAYEDDVAILAARPR
ncbi:hypothetical protein WB401_03390 [Streptomyces brasiliscabiei]|uniref:hypothetical protein n=1 Tax=Streptomyces brasiliscabiei TaxID=2736302 RepID=UPI0030144880